MVFDVSAEGDRKTWHKNNTRVNKSTEQIVQKEMIMNQAICPRKEIH